ncbi:MAG: DUF1540 domain-containing protein [Oscillospiraceae bacterium]
MNDTNKGSSRITGVGCSVCNCTHHTEDGHCSASRINVQNESALRKAETFCSTFAPKS